MLPSVFRLFIFLIITNLSYLISFSQSHGSANLDFLVAKIKNDYPGYRNKRKAVQFDKYLLRLAKDKTKDTFALLSKATTFFNDLHLVLYDFNIAKFIDSSQCKVQKRAILNYLNNQGKKNVNSYEGYWLSEYGNCIIGLKKVTASPISYKGYIVETTTKAPIGYCVFELVKEKDGNYSTDYREEEMGYRIFLKSKFKDSNTLYLNSYGKWRKIRNYKIGMLKAYKSFKYDIIFSKLDKETVLLTFPDFSGYNVKIVDSIIKKNDSLISTANTFIIDIRNNMGGTIRNYLPLIPFICTQPILRPNFYQLCSDDAIADFENDIKELDENVSSKLIKKNSDRRDSMLAHHGDFLFGLGDSLANNFKIREYPKNVAIITNNNCLSAAELMLLDFKQSKKVKIFGEITGGALDNLDALKIKLPKSGYYLFIATTKRIFSNSQPSYDNVGVKPDVSISDSTVNWIEFVKHYYESK